MVELREESKSILEVTVKHNSQESPEITLEP